MTAVKAYIPERVICISQTLWKTFDSEFRGTINLPIEELFMFQMELLGH